MEEGERGGGSEREREKYDFVVMLKWQCCDGYFQ